MSDPLRGIITPLLSDEDADQFVAAHDATYAEDRLRAWFAALRCLQALARRYGVPRACEAFRAAIDTTTRITPGEELTMLMRAMLRGLKATGAPDAMKQVQAVFSGDGPFGGGRTPEAVRRRLAPSRQTLKEKQRSGKYPTRPKG